MPPLPDGYVECSTVGTLGASATAVLANVQLPGIDHRVEFALGGLGWQAVSDIVSSEACGEFGDKEILRWEIRVSGAGMVSTLVASGATACGLPPHPRQDSPPLNFSVTAGPFRLGSRLVPIPGHESDTPLFAQNQRRQYSWFADERTTVRAYFGGVVSKTLYWLTGADTPPPPDVVDQGPVLAAFSFGGGGDGGATVLRGVLTSINVADHTPDTSDLATAVLVGRGAGAVDIYGTGQETASAAAPYLIHEDADVPKFGTQDSSGITVVDGDGTARAVPYSLSHTRPVYSWRAVTVPSTFRTLRISDAWADADAGRAALYPADDRVLLLTGAPGREPPDAAGRTFYSPATIRIEDAVNVLRPDGNTPSVFTSSDPAKLAVAELADRTRFTVTGPGATAARTLKEDWRAAIVAEPTDYDRTRHVLGDDVWGWNCFRYLRLTLAAPTAFTLSLRLEGVYLSVSDNHETSRVITHTEVPYARTYALSVPAGANTRHVDLAFPAEGGPFYHSRVDRIILGGFPAGETELRDLQLVSLARRGEDMLRGQAELKIGSGAPVSRGDYSALGLAHNGAWVYGQVADLANKTDETGTYGGYVRHTDPLTGTVSGLTLDSQKSLQSFLQEAGKQEGVTVTYDSSLYHAANRDGDGNTLGPEVAQWLAEGIFRFDAGRTFALQAAPRMGELLVTNLVPYRVFTRHPRWAAAEALVSTPDGAEPAEEGRPLTLLGVVGVTDSHGFVSWAPLETGANLPAQVDE